MGIIGKSGDIIMSFADKFNLISDDKAYIKHFEGFIGPKIYLKHLDEYFVCCAFCRHLKKSGCHQYCFICLKNTYSECGALLPGTFPFAESHFDATGNNTPWIFKTPCTLFERLDEKKYFRNFNSRGTSVTVAYYEALEGIFTGISRGKSPCHICASVNINIYSNCTAIHKDEENTYCSEIIEQISAKYKAIIGMIKYVE